MIERKPGIYLIAQTRLEREAARCLLEHRLHHTVNFDSGFDAPDVWRALKTAPKLVLVLTEGAPSEGVECVGMIARLRPTARILIVGAPTTPSAVQYWCTCRIHGFVTKNGGIEELREALEVVLSGQTYFSQELRSVVHALRAPDSQRQRLSRREAELLPLLARGMTLREAAATLSVSYKTADSYRTSLLRKLGVRDRVQLSLYAVRERIIEP